MKKQLTIKEIKAQLPDVKVTLDGKVYVGQVSGRDNPFATVTIRHAVWGFHYAQFSWQAIKRAVNDDTSLSL